MSWPHVASCLAALNPLYAAPEVLEAPFGPIATSTAWLLSIMTWSSCSELVARCPAVARNEPSASRLGNQPANAEEVVQRLARGGRERCLCRRRVYLEVLAAL
jgi:hypothetical protein